MAKARSGDAKFTFTNPALLGLTSQQAVYKVGMEVLRDAVKGCPVDTGTLARSITYKRGRNASMKIAEGEVGTDVFYAPFVEFGHGEITPKNGKFLVWTNSSGKKVFARSVKAAPARPFLGPALERARMKYGR